MADVTLSKAVRSNLLNLQSTAVTLGKTQERLATGLKVNSALDNPTNFFTSSALNSRASDLGQLLDSVSNAVQTIAAADKGITAISKLVESAQATARQALQTAATIAATPAVTASAATGDLTSVTIAADVNASAVTADLTALNATGGTITINGEDVTLVATDGEAEALTAIQTAATASAGANQFTVADNGDGTFTIEAAAGNSLVIGGDATTLTELGLTAGTTAPTDNSAGDITVNGQTVTLAGGDVAADILSALQTAATASAGANAFTVSNTDGVYTISGTAGNDVVIGGDANTLTALGLTAGTTDGTPVVAAHANPARAELVAQYNSTLSQIDQLSSDSGFNGVNLLGGSSLSVLFNEDGTSSLDVTGVTFDASGLGLDALATTAFDTDASINATLDNLKTGIDTLRSQASKFGANLSVVETRQDFTKNIINVLQTGAANLTLADTNEEAANLLALQTRQQLSTTALSLASQADQNVLRLF